MRLVRFLSLPALVVSLLLSHAAATRADDIDFATNVQPLLAKRCFSCHGPTSKRVACDWISASRHWGKTDSEKPAIVAGKSRESELLRRITSENDEERMPPEGAPLKRADVDALSQWIDQGAVYTAHWAFQPISHPVPPTVEHHDALQAPLDAFIVKRLEAKQLTLSPPAAAEDLIRRVYVDTIGLPPSPEAVAELASHWNDDTYARLVDRCWLTGLWRSVGTQLVGRGPVCGNQ